MKKYLLGFCALWLLHAFIAQAQDISARLSASNPMPLVGEPVRIDLFAALPPEAEQIIWPELQPAWGPFEVLTVHELQVGQINGQLLYQQAIDVVLWHPGEFTTPDLNLNYRLTGQTVASDLIFEPLVFTVPSVLTDNDTSLRPFKAQINVPFLPPQIIILAACLFASIIWWMVSRWQAYRRHVGKRSYQLQSLDEALLVALQKIDQQVLEPEAVYTLTADLLRDYVQEMFQIEAHELTTRELMRSLHNRLSPSMHQRLQTLLGQADLVKFARQHGDQRTARQYLESAGQWVRACALDLVHRKDAA